MSRLTKVVFHPGTYPERVNVVLLILRVVAGIFMLTHGLGKFDRLFGAEPVQFADPLGVGATTSLALTVFAEVFCSIFLILGLGTRLIAIPLLFTMMVAIFVIHIDDGFGRQELPGLFAVIFFAMAVLGAGKYSIDHLVTRIGKHRQK